MCLCGREGGAGEGGHGGSHGMLYGMLYDMYGRLYGRLYSRLLESGRGGGLVCSGVQCDVTAAVPHAVLCYVNP